MSTSLTVQLSHQVPLSGRRSWTAYEKLSHSGIAAARPAETIDVSFRASVSPISLPALERALTAKKLQARLSACPVRVGTRETTNNSDSVRVLLEYVAQVTSGSGRDDEHPAAVGHAVARQTANAVSMFPRADALFSSTRQALPCGSVDPRLVNSPRDEAVAPPPSGLLPAGQVAVATVCLPLGFLTKHFGDAPDARCQRPRRRMWELLGAEEPTGAALAG
jgi:hypothetical protein